MIVIATGPRGNGTSLLYRICTTGSEKLPLHIPAYPPWWSNQDWAVDFPTASFIIILRDPEAAARSEVRRGFCDMDTARHEQYVARGYLTTLWLRARHRVLTVYYEDLVADPPKVIDTITAFLRRQGYVGDPLVAPEPIPQ